MMAPAAAPTSAQNGIEIHGLRSKYIMPSATV